jgi:hypothetical protein
MSTRKFSRPFKADFALSNRKTNPSVNLISKCQFYLKCVKRALRYLHFNLCA